MSVRIELGLNVPVRMRHRKHLFCGRRTQSSQVGLRKSGTNELRPVEFWDSLEFLNMHEKFDEVLQAFEWWMTQPWFKPKEKHFARFITMAGNPDVAQHMFNEMESRHIRPTIIAFTALLQSYADNGDMEHSETLLKKMLDKNLEPDSTTYAALIRGYGNQGLLDKMENVFIRMEPVKRDLLVYKCLIEAYSQGGQSTKMEEYYNSMLKDGWSADVDILNMLGQGYANVENIKKLENIQSSFKSIRRLPTEKTIRAMALAYIRNNYFYQMGQLVRSLEMSEPKNLLWNLLLLTCAANFSMKALQRETQNMREAEVMPDLTTFNIRALAFSRMRMFWDLHILVRHMHSVSVRPDLVTYGAIVDAYVAGKLKDKLPEALDELEVMESIPDVRTELFVFEAFGKGRFHVFCEDYISRQSPATYSSLTTLYFEMLHRNKLDRRRKRRMLNRYNR